MTPTAITLLFLSALLHAGWNLLSKSRHPSAAFFLIACCSGAILLSPTLFLFRETVILFIPGRVWGLLAATGFCLALYYTSLAGAYRSGDISVAYPLARSSPVIVVSIMALLLGRGDQITGRAVAGIVLVVGGCFLIPLRRFTDLHPQNFLNATCGLALLAAMGSSGYSILDDEALRILRTEPGILPGNTQVTLLYACLEALSAACWLTVFVTFRRNGRASLRRVLNADLGHAVAAGTAIYLSYTLVLMSLAFVNNVSYAVGFRQLSIPLGAVLGFMFLREAPHPPKLAGLAIMGTGLMLLALG